MEDNLGSAGKIWYYLMFMQTLDITYFMELIRSMWRGIFLVIFHLEISNSRDKKWFDPRGDEFFVQWLSAKSLQHIWELFKNIL